MDYVNDVFKIVINKLFLKNFNVIFIENIKNYQSKLLFFSHKEFLRIFLKLMHQVIHLTFPLQNIFKSEQLAHSFNFKYVALRKVESMWHKYLTRQDIEAVYFISFR